MFDKLLVANRGEIALRVIRTCRRLGVQTVAVYSEADVRSRHVREADDAVYLGPAPAPESYLDMAKVVAAALEKGCHAVHPGYGFLSENPAFAERVAQAGLIFVGPPAEVIATLGDKIASKELARRAGVPVVPGHDHALDDVDEALRVARELGYPLLLKPAAGGGGKGMRVVSSDQELATAMSRGQEESRKAFGDVRVFLERYVPRPRHIEVQVVADRFGHVVALGERECSIQRRFQKVIEESPSPVVDAPTRSKLSARACALASAAGYESAGTVEFIRDPEGHFYFLEMNTRLQVEHPVTERVTGVDLVELQLCVAAGEPLPLGQEDVRLTGWAIEARICAEDPDRDFQPATGIVTRYAEPRGPDVRVDSGIEAGSYVGVHYDSLLAKVIVSRPTREEAITALVDALNRYHIEGVTTNLHFCNAIVNSPAFRQGDLSTDFIECHARAGEIIDAADREKLHHMAIAATLVHHNRGQLVIDSLKPMAARLGQHRERPRSHAYVVKAGDEDLRVELEKAGALHDWTARVDGFVYEVTAPEFEFYRRRLRLRIGAADHYFQLRYRGDFIWTAFSGVARTLEIYTPKEWELLRWMPAPTRARPPDALLSPMPGLVVEVKAAPGERVYRGQDLVTLESMKMESGVASPVDGAVAEIRVEPGQSVEAGDVLLTFKS